MEKTAPDYQSSTNSMSDSNSNSNVSNFNVNSIMMTSQQFTNTCHLSNNLGPCHATKNNINNYASFLEKPNFCWFEESPQNYPYSKYYIEDGQDSISNVYYTSKACYSSPRSLSSPAKKNKNMNTIHNYNFCESSNFALHPVNIHKDYDMYRNYYDYPSPIPDDNQNCSEEKNDGNNYNKIKPKNKFFCDEIFDDDFIDGCNSAQNYAHDFTSDFTNDFANYKSYNSQMVETSKFLKQKNESFEYEMDN